MNVNSGWPVMEGCRQLGQESEIFIVPSLGTSKAKKGELEHITGRG